MVSGTEQQLEPFRCLSLDGGGMRGLYTACLLENVAGGCVDGGVRDVGRHFKLIAGTSTGGILACGLGAGVSMDKLRELYVKHGPEIFPSPSPLPGKSFFGWAFKHRSRSSGDGSKLRSVLDATFGVQTLRDVWEARRIALCIPATHMPAERNWIFKTPHDVSFRRDRETRLVDVCMATGAAPIMLPLGCITSSADPSHQDVFVDGGLWANNPVLIAMLEALQLAKDDQPIHILSVGTAAPREGQVVDRAKTAWGLSQWRAGIGPLSLSLSAQSSGYADMADLLLPHLKREVRVVRLDNRTASAQQAATLGLDRADAAAIATLKDLARGDADTVLKKAALGKEFALLPSFFGAAAKEG